jgi:hypothetical protein
MKKQRLLFFALLCTLFTPMLAYGQTTVAPFLTANPQFFNNSGAPLNGGCLFTYAAGTSNAQATYSENTGTTPNANPIVLNSGGYATSGAIWLSGLAYKFVLKTAGGVNCASGSQLWSVDNITWSTPLSTFSGLTDAGNFNMTQPTVATVGANQSSFTSCIQGQYWTGAATATDKWCWQDVLGTGSNPTSTYTLTHTGSSGAATISFPSVTAQSVGTGKVDGACYLDGVTNTTLAAAVTCAGTNGVIVIPPFASPTLTGNVTIPAGVTIEFQGSSPGQVTLGNFNLVVNGPIRAAPAQIFVYGGTGTVTLGVAAVAGTVRAEWFPGADWCVKAQNADNSFSAIGGEYWVSQNMTTASCSNNITIAASHVLHAEAGFYSLGSFSFVPNGTGASIICASWLTNFNYTGTGFAYDLNTQTQAHFGDCQISLGATAAGGLRLRNTSNGFETRAYIRGVLVSAPVRTAGQIGVYLEATNALSANYHSEIEVQTQTIDIGAEFKSLVNNQGANANHLSIRCNGHTICVQEFDGTDNIIQGTILGANGGGNGIGINLCAAGNGGYGVSNNILGPLSFEQGSTGGGSTSIKVAAAGGLTVGCSNSSAIGQSNDANTYVDANTPPGTNLFFNTLVSLQVLHFNNAASCITQVSAGFLAVGNCTPADQSGSWGANVGFFIVGTRISNTGIYQYSSTSTATGAFDLGTSRKAVGVLAIGNGNVGDITGLQQSAMTVRVGSSGFTTANNTNLQTITGLSWTIPATALNWSFACDLSYSQATANVAVAFGIQAATNNPTNIYATGTEQITVGPPATFVTGTLATLATTTGTNIVSGTPTALATNYTVHLGGTIENPALANTINIMVSTANGADAVTVLRGSTCHFTP